MQITGADGVTHEYLGGIDINWESEILLFAESAAPPALSLSLWFDDVNVAQLVADGHTLAAMVARLYRWAPGVAHKDRAGVFFGIARQPNYGGPDEPIAVTFEAPLYRDGTTWPEGRVEAGQITVDASAATGDGYPVLFGAPGLSSATLSEAAGSPALHLVAGSKKLLAGVWLGDPATVDTLWNVSDDASESVSASGGESDLKGRRVFTVTSSAVGFDADDDYAIEWTGNDIGAGDLLMHCATASTLRADLSRMRALRTQLNAFKFSGYVDADTKPWRDFAVREIIPLLPCSASHTADGIALSVWNDQATAADAVMSLDTSNGITRIGPVQYEAGDELNEITIRFAPNWSGDFTETRTITGRQDLGTGTETIVSALAIRSRTRLSLLDAAGPLQGVRQKTIETPYVFDEATAIRILTWMIRARALPRRVVTYEDTSGHLEVLREGQHVTLTDSELALSSQLALVRSRRWQAGRFFLDLMLVES